MKACVLKSYPNGIAVYLSDELEFEELLAEVKQKFMESAKFFKKAKLAVSFEGRELDRVEEDRLIDAIEQNTEIEVLCVVGKDEENNIAYLKALEKLTYRATEMSGPKLYRGSVKDGQTLETQETVIVLGDVNPGCAVHSTKDIIILGGLYGEAHAGIDSPENHFVLALEMSFERLKIGDLRFRTYNEKKPFWPVKQKLEPKIAVVENDTVVLKPYHKNSLEELF